MEPTYLDSSFMNWLFDNTLLAKFIEINMLKKTQDKESITNFMANLEMMRQKQLLRLNQFYETALKVLYVESEAEPKLVNRSQSISFFNSHVLYYVDKKMREIRREYLKKSMQLTETLMNLIKDPKLAAQKVDIIVDEERFFTEMISDPPNYLRLKSFSKSLFKKPVFCKNIEQLKEKILKILNNACLQVDKTSYYFRESKLQEEFDEIILDKKYPLFAIVNGFLNTFSNLSRKLFTPKVTEIFNQFMIVLNLNLDPILSSCLFIFIIRSVFSQAYVINPEYFYPSLDKAKIKSVKTIASKVPCSYFAISDDTLPPHNPDDKMIDVFSQNKFYMTGALHLQFAAMLLNPIDAIYEIHEMMICNHRGAEIIVNDPNVSVFPFETTFGLFIASVLSSDLPNFEQVAEFVSDFAPPNGLCPEFEFVATTTRAAYTFCLSLLETFSN